MRYDTLIVGAGLSGLAAGIRLAWAGERVAVLERHYLWGGLNSFYKLAGRRFDSGLHALTNWSPPGGPGGKGGQLARALRALRIDRDSLKLGEQSTSFVAFLVEGQELRLRFSNDLDLLRSEVARLFPGETGRFEQLLAALPEYGSPRQIEPGARARLAGLLGDPLLGEMLLCAPCLYGSAREDDMDWDAFGVLFRSIFLEGLCRPSGGIKPLLDALCQRLADEGGELRLRCGVSRIRLRGDRAVAVELEQGGELECERVLSSAGLLETLSLSGRLPPQTSTPQAGRISVLETTCVLDRPTRELGHLETVGFFNEGPRLRWSRPEEACEVRTGVLVSPDNYRGQADLPEGRLRVSVLADPAAFESLPEDEYSLAKARWSEAAIDSAARFAFDPRPHEVQRDVFTPRTIRRFTSHLDGALYGSPDKHRGGAIGLENVFLIGNDESYPGIVGALMSGIGVAAELSRSRTGVETLG